jgi:sugar lactone lactonase YvrE
MNLRGLGVEPVGEVLYFASTVYPTSSIYRTSIHNERASLAARNIEEEEVVGSGGHVWSTCFDLAAGKLYWTSVVDKAIRRADLADGANVETLLSDVDGLSGPMGLALDLNEQKMYWADYLNSSIQRADFDGSNMELLVVDSTSILDINVVDLHHLQARKRTVFSISSST